MPLPLATPPIARPPWSQAAKEMESLIRKAIFDFTLLDEGQEKIAIALSGGKDSLTLLYFLASLRGRGFKPFELFAIHIGGEVSCGAGVQQELLQSICKELGVTLIQKIAKPLSKLECYSCSRQRRTLIFDAAKEVGATTIAFGHHREDSAETLLLNLCHKAEFAGMLPKVFMRRYGITIIRPLIYISEEAIRSFAKEHGFARITCQCPVGARSNRKKVRLWMEELEVLFPHVKSNLAKAGIVYGSKKADLDP